MSLDTQRIKTIIHDSVKATGSVFENQHYRFRPFNKDDLGVVREIYSHPIVNALLVVPTKRTEAEYAAKLKKFMDGYQESGLTRYVVERKSDHAVIGVAGFAYLAGQEAVEANLVLLPKYHKAEGKGVAKALCECGINKLGLGVLFSETLSVNLPTQMALREAGMLPARNDAPRLINPNPKDANTTVFVITKEQWAALEKGAKVGPIDHIFPPHPKARCYAEMIRADRVYESTLLKSTFKKLLTAEIQEELLAIAERRSTYQALKKQFPHIDFNFGRLETATIARDWRERAQKVESMRGSGRWD